MEGNTRIPDIFNRKSRSQVLKTFSVILNPDLQLNRSFHMRTLKRMDHCAISDEMQDQFLGYMLDRYSHSAI